MSEARPQRTNAETWRKVEPPADSSPAPRPVGPSLEEWGVTQDEARDLLRRQMCPACGRGPWKSPLNHASRKHGFDQFTMREICGITTVESVVDSELAARLSENNKDRDMSKVGRAERRKYRVSTAGRAAMTANIVAVNTDPEAAEAARALALAAQTPEARARQGEALRQRYAAMSAEERAERAKHLRRSPEELAQQSQATWDAIGRQPCGTRAAYRRGCRCDKCRDAYLAYRKTHG